MTDAPAALRAAALRHLTRMLATRRFWASVNDPWDEDAEETSAAVEAMVAVGALSAEEGRAWRARLERASTWPEPPDPALHARAVEHLEAVADDEGRLGGALAAFAGAGLVSRDEEKEWDARLSGEEPPVEVSAMRLRIGESRPEFDDSVLLRTVAGPEERVAGLRVTVVELYERAVVVHWHYAADGSAEAEALGAQLAHEEIDDDEDDPFGEDMDEEEWLGRWDIVKLSDDLGTRYESGSSSWGSHRERTASGHDAFAPGVPAGARYLEVMVQERVLRVDLGA